MDTPSQTLYISEGAPHGNDLPYLNKLISDEDAAELLGLSRSYLRRLRCEGGGCRYSKFGSAVRYRVGDLIAWAESRTVDSTSAMAAR